jgi:hypothetical protein
MAIRALPKPTTPNVKKFQKPYVPKGAKFPKPNFKP